MTKEEKEIQDLQDMLDIALDKLDNTLEEVIFYQKLFLTAGSLLDLHVPLDGGRSWCSLILETNEEIDKKKYS